MTFVEFQTKWGNIRCRHDDTCPARNGFETMYDCDCGLDDAWARREKDLATVPIEELRAFWATLKR